MYVHPGFRRLGVGSAVYTSLFECLRLQGYRNAFGGIALPNPGSVKLHESLGFIHVGTYANVGYKLAAWHSVGWWQLELQSAAGQPQPPVALPQLRDTEALTSCLLRGWDLVSK